MNMESAILPCKLYLIKWTSFSGYCSEGCGTQAEYVY